jgi:minor extracellular serine protease Vpr
VGSRRFRLAFSITSVAVLVITLIGPAAANEPVRSADRAFERIPLDGIDPQLLPASSDDTRPVTVMLELAGQPVARQQAAARQQGRDLTDAQKAAARRALKAAQDRLRPQIESNGGRVLAQLQDAYNGVKVRVGRSQLAALAGLPGVVGVHGIAKFEPNNDRGVPYIGGPAAWSGGLTGAGVTIAVIDTGVDYYHANLGGSGDPADFAADDGLTIEPGTFPTAKVVGGTDFVGDAYDASGEGDALVPHPDPDPLDCNGHGSHVAGTAAGNGVLADGSAYSGPYDETTHGTVEFTVAPGVAPEATILAYRVFGCDGSSDVVAEAIDQAVEDGADVINMSLGSPFGGAAAEDPTAVAAQNAVDAGVIVVASAGNDGPNAFMVGSPSTAAGVISVAAMDTIDQFRAATIVGGALNLTAINANEHPLTTPVSGPLRVLTSGSAISLGCDAADYAGVQPGDIVVTMRGVCARVDRAILGEAAGAAAVIMVNNADTLPPLEGPIPREGGIVEIPFLGVRSSAGADLLAANGTTVTITDAGVIANPGFRGLASFTSGGPRSGDNGLKPDVTAPGVSVLSTGVGLGTGGVRISGTSMAAPHTAGAAALVHQANPDWSPAAVRAALMNTASGDASLLSNANPRLAGAGVVQVNRATTTNVLATEPSLSYGYEPLGAAYSETLTLTFANGGASAVTYDLASAFNGNALGTDLTFSAASVVVPAGGQASVDVTLALTAAEVAALPAALQAPGALTTVRGVVTATPSAAADGVYPLRVPFLLSPRGLSNITVAGAPTRFGSTNVTLTNGGIHAGDADVYAWGQTDPEDTGGMSIDLRAVGVQSLPGELGGLPASDRLLIFAVNTHGRWSNASEAEFDIAIDVTGSPAPDFFVVGVDLGAVLAGAFDGRYGSFVFDANFNLIDAFFAQAPMNGSTVLLPAAASSLGLSADVHNKFMYSTAGFSLLGPEFDVAAGAPRFRPWEPTSSQGDFISLDPGEQAGLTLSASPSAKSDNTLGWMIVNLDDANEAPQAELIALPRR